MEIYNTRDQIEAEIIQSLKMSGNFKRYVFTPLSKTYTFIRAIAGGIFLFVSSKMIEFQNAIHPHTSRGAALSDWMSRYDLVEKGAIAARHNIRIGSSGPVHVSTILAQGLIVDTDGPDTRKIKFKLVDTYTISAGVAVDARGFYTIPAIVECVATGPVGNVTAESIVKIESAPSGIDVVYNPDATPLVSGAEAETDIAKQSRIKIIETGTNQMWTPDWYRSQALANPLVWRAIHLSSKTIGIAGLSKLLVTAKITTISQVVVDALYNDLNLNESKSSGAGLVLVENISRVDVNRIVTVKFLDPGMIPPQADLDQVAEKYFLSLNLGDPFVYDELRSLYFQFIGVKAVTFSLTDPITPMAGQLATPGSMFSVVGEVFL